MPAALPNPAGHDFRVTDRTITITYALQSLSELAPNNPCESLLQYTNIIVLANGRPVARTSCTKLAVPRLGLDVIVMAVGRLRCRGASSEKLTWVNSENRVTAFAEK